MIILQLTKNKQFNSVIKMEENIQEEKALLEIEKIEIDFTPILFITRSMETWEGER